MSKLERLNARVAKLLTEALQEVLEIVKETVSEYQDNIVRTQRENNSLKRRLQELQDDTTRENTEQGDTKNEDKDSGLALRQNSDLPLAEQNPISSHKPDPVVKHGSKQQKSYIKTEPEAECNLVQVAEHSKTQPKAGPHDPKEATIVHLSLQERNINAVSVSKTSISQANAAFGMNLPPISREAESTDSTSSEPINEVHRLQGHAEPCGVVLINSNQVLPRRHGFAKANGTALDGRKIRMEEVRRDDSHSCVICGKTFSRVRNLRIHQRCHTGEKPYGCTQCGRCFSQAGDLKKHKRVHTGEKPYFCNQCGKSFSRGENLKRHQKIHIGENLHSQKV